MLAGAMKILIVSASVGAGHTQAAKAVAAGIGRRYPAISTQIVDFMAEENSYLNTLLKETYLKMISLSPNIYDLLYRWSQSPRQSSKVQNMVARAMKRSMWRLYLRYRPDMIICTHPFPCGAAAILCRTHRINIPLVAVITDYAVHPLWVYDEVDLYFVAEKEMHNDLVKYGIPDGRIYSTGIPIDASFSQHVERAAIIEELRLEPGLPTVLVMGGGLGVGPVREALSNLDSSESPLQIIVVAGKNAVLRRQLQQLAKRSRHHMVILGFTHRIRELMAVADILVTKPGALTISEALSQALPLVLFSPIPGQEEENAEYLVRQGAAILVERIDTLGAEVTALFANPEKLAEMRSGAHRLGQPRAADVAASIIGNCMTLGRAAAGV